MAAALSGAAAALAVTTGLYVATPGTPSGTGARPPAAPDAGPAAAAASEAPLVTAVRPAVRPAVHPPVGLVRPARPAVAAPAVPDWDPDWDRDRDRDRDRDGDGSAGTMRHYVAEVVARVNVERVRGGCAPLRSNARLGAAAQAHADDMAARGYYAHRSPGGRNAGDRISAAHYRWSAWAENIHRGPHTPARAVSDWMNSEDHRKNILDCRFRDIGVGVNLAANGPWWVQNFARGR